LLSWIKARASWLAAALFAAVAVAVAVAVSGVVRGARLAAAIRDSRMTDIAVERVKARRAAAEASGAIDAAADAEFTRQIQDLRKRGREYRERVMNMSKEELDREQNRLGL
jgi:biopolymer transport protein ExbB/TolQ